MSPSHLKKESLVDQVRTDIANHDRGQRKPSIKAKQRSGTQQASPEAWLFNNRWPQLAQPRTIIDVGVGRGTSNLYQAYPSAYYLLIEPVEEFSFNIKNILRRHKGLWIRAAASSVPGKQTFFVNNKFFQISSFFANTNNAALADELEAREVDVVRLDQLVESLGLAGPYIIKTDTEGFDLEVLEGAGKLLQQTTFVISECRADSDLTGPTLNNIIKFLFSNNFEIVDLLDLKWEKNGRLRWANIVFVNQTHLSALPR